VGWDVMHGGDPDCSRFATIFTAYLVPLPPFHKNLLFPAPVTSPAFPSTPKTSRAFAPWLSSGSVLSGCLFRRYAFIEQLPSGFNSTTLLSSGFS